MWRPETDKKRQFNNYLAHRAMKKLRLLQICIGMFFLFRTISNWIRPTAVVVPALCLILAISLPILFGTVLKPQIRTKNRSKRQMIAEYAFQCFAATLFCAGIVSTYMANYQILSDFPYLMFISGLDWVWIAEIFGSVFPRLLSFQFFIPCVVVPVIANCWQHSELDLYTKSEITIRAFILIFSSTMMNYLKSEDSKELFYLKMGLEEREILYREILDQLPECVIILSPELKPHYFNDCFWQQIGGSRNAQGEELLAAFFERTAGIAEATSELKEVVNEPHYTNGMRETLEAFLAESAGNTKEDEKNCKIYRGYMKIQGCEDERTEPVEIKLRKIMFAQESSLLVVVRRIPEYELLMKLDQTLKYKDEVLAAVSHELRTPINSNINLVNEAIKSPLIPETIKHDLLDPAYKSGRLLLNIVNDILDLSQIKENKLRLVSQCCSIRAILEDCRHLFESQCKQKGIALELEVDKSVPNKIRTDPNRLTQVILNLISNAYKFTFEGKIAIKATRTSEGLIHLSVSDTGIGIKAEDTLKLMKKFEKIDLGDKAVFNSTGCGLGLYIANTLATLLGSNDPEKQGLKFKSEVGVGTTVSFFIKSKDTFDFNLLTGATYLTSIDEVGYSDYIDEDKDTFTHFGSRSADDSIYVSPVTKSDLEMRRKCFTQPDTLQTLHDECRCPTVMIVDDDCFNGLTIASMLKSFGVEYDSAFSGRQCLEKFRNGNRCRSSCKKFKLVLMDANMPVKDGFETTKELVAWNKTLMNPLDINVIGCTAHTSKDKWEEFKNSGAKECITKPLSKETLKRLLVKYNIY